MNFESMTNEAIAREMGRRIEQLRLERNMTQQAVADAIGISRVSYGKLEAGEAKLTNVVATLRVLGQLTQLEQLLPASVFSPMALLKLKGKRRKRAAGKRKPKSGTATNDDQQQSDLDW